MWLFWPIECTGNDDMHLSSSCLGMLTLGEASCHVRSLSPLRIVMQGGNPSRSQEEVLGRECPASQQLLHSSQCRCQTSKWRWHLAHSTQWSLHLTPAPADPTEPTKLWEGIIIWCFKPPRLGEDCHTEIDNQNTWILLWPLLDKWGKWDTQSPQPHRWWGVGLGVQAGQPGFRPWVLSHDATPLHSDPPSPLDS